MAYQTGVIDYMGSFKSIRHYKNRKDRRIYASEKGGANRNLIMKSPVFKRTRENMSEFEGCGVAVKAIRMGLKHLIPEFTDAHFTSRLTKMVKMINRRDPEGERGKRSIMFSHDREILGSISFHEKRKIDFELKRHITKGHSFSRAEATITVNDLNPEPKLVPGSAQFYRVINHVSIISDFFYKGRVSGYKPLSPLDGASAFVYSDYTPVNTPLSASLTASFSEGTVLGENDTVLQCVGIEFYILSGVDGYVPYSTGCLLAYDVF